MNIYVLIISTAALLLGSAQVLFLGLGTKLRVAHINAGNPVNYNEISKNLNAQSWTLAVCIAVLYVCWVVA